MSASKSNYPEKPLGGRRPAKPGEQRKKPSSEKRSGKSKAWMSLRSKVEGGFDVSPRLNFPWWKAPIYKDARLRKWA